MKELHGLAGVPKVGQLTGDAEQQIRIADYGPDAISVNLSKSYPTVLTAEQARFIARLLVEAAERVELEPPSLPAAEPVARPALSVAEMKPAPISPEIAAIGDEDIDTSDIPEFVTPPETDLHPPATPRVRKRLNSPDRMWTEERMAILKRDVPAGVSREAIAVKVNALPGPFVSAGRVSAQTGALHLKWPAPASTEVDDTGIPTSKPDPEASEAVRAHAEELWSKHTPTEVVTSVDGNGTTHFSVKPDAPTPEMELEAKLLGKVLVRPPPETEREVDFNQVEDWGHCRGFRPQSWDDHREMARLNAKRQELNQPVFVPRRRMG